MMNTTNKVPEETVKFIEERVAEEIAAAKEKVQKDLEDLKRNYIPRTDVAKFKAHIIEYHTDEEGRYFKNAYIHVEELVKLIDKMLLKGDQEDVKL